MLAEELRQRLNRRRQRNAQKAACRARLEATRQQNRINHADEEDFVVLVSPEVDVIDLTEDCEFN